jgi:hypothetical protein
MKIQTEYLRSGGATILTFMDEGASAVISFCMRSEMECVSRFFLRTSASLSIRLTLAFAFQVRRVGSFDRSRVFFFPGGNNRKKDEEVDKCARE